MQKLFGTDGIRAVAGEFPLDYPTVFTLGRALAALLEQEGLPPRVLIGRDTRESGEWLEGTLYQSFKRNGCQVVTAGVIPTSAVSILTRKFGFSAGVVVSASHNPFQDNGIKVFSPEGIKIPEEWEAFLERALHSSEKKEQRASPPPPPDPAMGEEYVAFLLSRYPEEIPPPSGLLVVDCSNGAASPFAPLVFSRLGMDVVTIGASPDGKNINAGCGCLHPQGLVKRVLETRADLGVAFDGDADRAILVDERGNILNGDHTLFLLSRYMKSKGRLSSGSVVATTMSNMGLEKALEKMGLELVRSRVGDRYVLEEMIRCGANLGGERSGHTILLDDCPTGDGILTTIRILEVIRDQGRPLSEMVRDYTEYPQILLNVPVSRKEDFSLFPEITQTVETIRSRLGRSGRLNLRYSGTERLARVMVEGPDREMIEEMARHMAGIITKHLG